MGNNYEKGLYKQLVEQLEQTEHLQAANKVLRTENASLKQELSNLKSKLNEIESRMAEKLSSFVEEAIRQSTAPLIDELNKAHTEISRLKSLINKDSSNSSKPSSTNGFKIIPNSREKSGKPQGGQKGHPGHRLQLPENMEELEAKGIIERRVEDYTGGSSEYVSKYTIDLQMKVIITEHRFTQGAVPEGFYNEVSYGDTIKAQVVLLLNEGIVSHKRLSALLSGMTHNVVNLSTGTINKFHGNFAGRLALSGELELIKQDLLNGELMHTDDTSMRILQRIVYPEDEKSDEPIQYEAAEKGSLRATVRTHSNERSTFYTVNPRKDKKGIERDGILPLYLGTLCHDHELKFFNYGKNNACCGVHLMRDLKGLGDSYNCPWAVGMRKFILEMNNHKNNDVSLGAKACDSEKLASFENEYAALLEQGRQTLSQMKGDEWGRSEFNAMLNRLTNFKDNYMLFMRDYKVPFTNNLAERDLRSEKTKEKVSGLFRSWKGIEDHAKVRSFISTLKKRKKELFSAIKLVMQKEPVLTA
jgi:cell division protein FtsB